MTEAPMKLVVNCETGIAEYFPLSAEEQAQREADAAAYAAQQAAAEVEAKKVADAKASAIAKLSKLGLTEAEVTALLG